MTVITTADADWDILTDIRDTLADAEVSQGVAAFKSVVIGESIEDFAATATETPAALVRCVGVEESDTGDNGDDRVALLETEVLVRVRKADARNAAEIRLGEVNTLLNLSANALMTDPTRGGNAEASVIDGRLRPATRICRHTWIQSEETFATGRLSVFCALAVTDTGR